MLYSIQASRLNVEGEGIVADLNEFKDLLVTRIFEQVIQQTEICVDGDVYVDPEKISPVLTELIVEVLQEDEVKREIKNKVRKVVMGLDEKVIRDALQPEIGKGFIKRLFGL